MGQAMPMGKLAQQGGNMGIGGGYGGARMRPYGGFGGENMDFGGMGNVYRPNQFMDGGFGGFGGGFGRMGGFPGGYGGWGMPSFGMGFQPMQTGGMEPRPQTGGLDQPTPQGQQMPVNTLGTGYAQQQPNPAVDPMQGFKTLLQQDPNVASAALNFNPGWAAKNQGAIGQMVGGDYNAWRNATQPQGSNVGPISEQQRAMIRSTMGF
jgi:hypothetical protein